MKRFTYFLLASILWTACSNDKKPAEENDANKTEELNQNLASVLNGVWVSKDYFDAVAKTKSPFAAAEKLQDVVAFNIGSSGNSDSIEVNASWNNHEGYRFAVFMHAGQNETSLKTSLADNETKSNFYEIGYEKTNGDTVVFLYHYDKSNKLIDKKPFSKVKGIVPDNDPSLGLQYLVNEKLFAGNYVMIDNKNASVKINLKSDGTLTGFPDFKNYYVVTDFMGGPEANTDEIIFNMQTENSKSFAFKNVNDTICLYNLIGNEAAGESLKPGKIQYKLVRQN